MAELNRSCPCTYGNPCRENCTCVVPTSSMGCARCCSYGSREQRQQKAAFLIEMLELGIETERNRIIDNAARLVNETVFKLGEKGVHIAPEELLDATKKLHEEE